MRLAKWFEGVSAGFACRSVVWRCAIAAGVLALGACSRDHIEAINLANEGDKAVSVNVSNAIKKYEQATRLDPSNHRILWKLAQAHQKSEEWGKAESTLNQAIQRAPDFADYYYYRGYALMQIGFGGNKDSFEDAKEPLKQCVAKDSNHADCYHWLGQANLWTGDEQSALRNYTKAIEHNPKTGHFYAPLAEAYIHLRLYKEAEQVLKAGEKHVDKVQKNKDHLYSIYTLLFQVHQAKGDLAKGVQALETANSIAGDTHPEIAFNLGSTYAVMDPPKKDKAVRLLKSFNKRACKGRKAKKYRDQCETSASMVQKLGGQ